MATCKPGVFTTFLIRDSKVVGFNNHIDRLLGNANDLFNITFDRNLLLTTLHHKLSSTVSEKGSYRCKISISKEINFPIKNNDTAPYISIEINKHNPSLAKPINAMTIDLYRNLSHIKSTHLFESFIAKQSALNSNVDDAIFSKDGYILEGSTWNIFFIDKSNVIHTPSGEILPGIARKTIISMAEELGYTVRESLIQESRIGDFKSCFATNSVFGINAIQSINNHAFEHGNIINELSFKYQDQFKNILEPS